MELSPLIDTNILLLYVIGSVDHGTFIDSSNRLKGFSYDDYMCVIDFIDKISNFSTTTYILTEVSNLIDLHGEASDEAFKTLRAVSSFADLIDVVPMNDTKQDHFLRYGITDSNILSIAMDRKVMTNDRRLMSFAYSMCPHENIIPWDIIRQGFKC